MKNRYSMKQLLTVIAILTVSYVSFGQQDPQFTQYMYNMSVINPAYATGEEGKLDLGVIYRNQWAGIEGAPDTGNFFAHYAAGNNVEFGLSLAHDQIGDVVNETNLYADFAYVLSLDEFGNKLSLGVKGGFTFFNTNFRDIRTNNRVLTGAIDPAFTQDISETFPNIGAGAFLFGDKYYVGISAPNFLETEHLENENGITALGAENLHFFATGGYVFDINEYVKFKPSTMLKGVSGAPLDIDLNANFLFNERFEAGVGYRLDDAVMGLVNFQINDNFKVGYAYDYTTSGLRDFSNGSHEVFLLFDIGLSNFKPGFDKSPRFF